MVKEREVKNSNHMVRVGDNFNKEINDIQKERVEIRVDKKKKSIRILTNLLVRHKLWPKIKQEMMEEILDD